MKRVPLTRAVESAFRESLPGVLGESYDAREEQLDMASSVAAAIARGGVEVVEAETGLGKSLAYLVPVILHCMRSGGRAVVSTYTRNLQRQLISKDFPLACRTAGAGAAGVTGALLMGRGNYACRRRVERLVGDPAAGTGPGRRTRDALRNDPARAAWLRSALADQTGELDAIPGASLYLDAELRAKAASPSRDAVCAGCRLRDDCFMLRARRRALDSQVVITNHALLFSDVAVSGALLGQYDVLVVDEAHHLEDVATDFFSLSFSPRTVRGAAHSVYAPEYEENVRYVRAMVAADGLDAAKSIDALWASFHDALEKADRYTAELFALLARNASGATRSEGPDTFAEGRSALGYWEGAPLLYGADTPAAGVSRALGQMEAAAAEIVDIVEGHESLTDTGAGAAVRAVRDTAGEARAQFNFLLSGSAEDHVFYARLDGSSAVSALAASPVDVSARLGAVLEERSRTAVLTSATLAVDGDFSFTLERLGLAGSGRAATRRYDSPFDFDERRLVLLADHLPDPADETFLPQASAVIEDAVGASGRRALILCTARGQIAALERELSGSATVGAELLLQKDGASREDLLERFRRARRGVLVGLASFWEGVDLPGEDLELLVVLKLPFMVPTEPVTRARARRVEDAGENPFEKLFLPDVVLKLRQGMGRLIRTSRDRGVVIILDRRLGHSRYGDFVLRAVTDRSVRCGGREEIIEQLKRYFDDR